ncbi:hypothetical protein GCM10009789_17190 [Kribbella sancticallisti]|uniref:Uncharacterized protein n=1 Tax=Kribbella sancticallisti TaxID=460087 RepID=A0ABP4NT03_9ACTN
MLGSAGVEGWVLGCTGAEDKCEMKRRRTATGGRLGPAGWEGWTLGPRRWKTGRRVGGGEDKSLGSAGVKTGRSRQQGVVARANGGGGLVGLVREGGGLGGCLVSVGV